MLTKPHTIEFKPIAPLPANADEPTRAAEKAPWDLERIQQGHTGQVALKGTLEHPIIMPDVASVGLDKRFGMHEKSNNGS